MGAYILINVIALSCVNILFLLLGSFLNAVVILCFWKSNNLRKMRCHFMILVLSCVDLAVVVVIHPLIIFSTLTWHVENEALQDKLDNSKYVTSVLYALSFYALLTMNIERYVAIKYPIYHWTSMTKTKMMLVFSAFLLLVLILKVLSAKGLAPEQLSSSITFLFLVIIMVPTNCKMYAIARRAAKRNKERAEKQKQQSTTVTFQDSHKIQGECDNLHDAESTNLHEESNSLHEESNNLHEESNKSNEESNNLHEDSNKSHEESNKSHEECNKSHEESNKSHEESNKSHEESNKSHEESNKSHEESNKSHEESNKSHEESNKSHEESNKSHEESNKSHEECNKSHEESNNLQNDNVQDKQRNKLSPKNISTCILAVACFILCALPGMIFNGIIFSQGKSTFDKDHYKVFLLWIRTLITMNSSFNTLVFFWKNSTLRKEGKQVLKKIR